MRVLDLLYSGDRALRDDDELPGLLSAAEWDRRADRILDQTEYDTELGKQLARDALRVTKGELSEEEFHRKHHEAVKEEFGVDNRPTRDEDDDE